MKIEIITTPNTDLKETGFGSLKSCTDVLNSVQKMGHTVRVSVCSTEQDLSEIVKRSPSLVILASKYIPVPKGDDVWLSDYFAKAKINFSGSMRKVLKFDSDKVLAKTHLRKNGVKTANFFTAIPKQFDNESELPFLYPLFLKPLDAANGNGVDDLSFVSNFEEFESKLSSLYARFNAPVLVEEYLNGQEFTVAIIRTVDGEMIVSPIEIIPPNSSNGLRILGEQTKTDDSEELKKAGVSILVDRVKKVAVEAFVGLGVRDFGRIDIKTNKNGQCYFMEANLVPGMTSGSSYFPKACELANQLSYDEVIRMIVAKCISRAMPTVAV